MSLVFEDLAYQEHSLSDLLWKLVSMSDNSFKVTLGCSITFVKLILSIVNWES